MFKLMQCPKSGAKGEFRRPENPGRSWAIFARPSKKTDSGRKKPERPCKNIYNVYPHHTITHIQVKPMKTQKRFISLVASVFAASTIIVAMIVVTGCVAEDMSACSPSLRLTFRYTHNTSRKNQFAESVRSVDVYVFDYQTGVLADVIGITQDDLSRGWHDEFSMPAGHYTMVAWGASSEKMTRSYAGRQMLDESSHEHTDVKIGTTTFDDFYMMLESADAPSGTEGDIVPATPDFDNLFWAMADVVEVVDGDSRRVDFDFIRNTSTLRIAVTGIEYFEAPSSTRQGAARLPLRLFATGENGRYRYDDTIDPYARTVHYASRDHRRTGDGLSVNIPMQRLHIRRHEDAPVLLHIESLSGSIPGIPPVDLVSAIRESNDGMGNYPYSTQESIDREHEFRIALAISPDPDRPGWYRLTMTINEWDVIIIEPIVDVPN